MLLLLLIGFFGPLAAEDFKCPKIEYYMAQVQTCDGSEKPQTCHLMVKTGIRKGNEQVTSSAHTVTEEYGGSAGITIPLVNINGNFKKTNSDTNSLSFGENVDIFSEETHYFDVNAKQGEIVIYLQKTAKCGALKWKLPIVTPVVRSPHPYNINWKAGDGAVWWSNGCDFLGWDFQQLHVPADKCGGECAKREDCKTFTWANGVCYLKRGPQTTGESKVPPKCATHSVVCGYKGLNLGEISREAGKILADSMRSGNVWWNMNCDYKGGDIRNVKSRGQDCGGICDRDRECNAFTWTNYQGGTCYLKKHSAFPRDGTLQKLDGAVCGRAWGHGEKNVIGSTANSVRCI